jgi:phospholipid/cholesterol/gamma-HCH transport system substrate-binding protein
MSAPTNHWKLGLFVVVGILLGITAIVYLGARSLQKETVSYKSYLDEAVTGLEIGSPVKFRGVTVGNVSMIDIAQDRRHIELTYELAVATLSGLGLAASRGQQTRIAVPGDLRVQLGSQGITGVKYILIDFFDAQSHPPPKLPFPIPQNYIPATSSTMKNIEGSVVRAVDQFPVMSEQLSQVLTQVNQLLTEINGSGLTTRASATLARTDRVLDVLSTKLGQVRAKELSDQASMALTNLNATLTRVHGLLGQVEGDQGLLASVQRATDSVGDAAGNAQGFGAELEDTLTNLGEAADAIRDLVDALERDSDMLVKGRAKAER